jgi:hypothetical protein
MAKGSEVQMFATANRLTRSEAHARRLDNRESSRQSFQLFVTGEEHLENS